MAKNVLIVEDNELNMKLFKDVLSLQGYGCLTSRDGRDTVDLVRKYHPDLILMDINLPDVSGFELAQKLKADGSCKGIPIIAVTAFAMKGDEERVVESGCDSYMTKPVVLDQFLAAVRRYLE